MPDEAAPTRLLVGGHGAVRFAVRADGVEAVVGEDALPPAYSSVCVPRLFDVPAAPAREARFARVRRREGEAYLDLGGAVTARALPPQQVAPVPAVLRRTAARWAWDALATDDEGFVVVVDAGLLASLASPKRRGEAP